MQKAVSGVQAKRTIGGDYHRARRVIAGDIFPQRPRLVVLHRQSEQSSLVVQINLSLAADRGGGAHGHGLIGVGGLGRPGPGEGFRPQRLWPDPRLGLRFGFGLWLLCRGYLLTGLPPAGWPGRPLAGRGVPGVAARPGVASPRSATTGEGERGTAGVCPRRWTGGVAAGCAGAAVGGGDDGAGEAKGAPLVGKRRRGRGIRYARGWRRGRHGSSGGPALRRRCHVGGRV